jgi:sulfofructose kinase
MEARRQEAFAVSVVDTLAAGDVFHAAFALSLAEGRREAEALRFASAAAALKCTRFGGILGAPARAEVDQLLRNVG